MSLAEVGLALKSRLLAPRSESAASVENCVLRHSSLERGETPKDILKFPLSFCPTAAEISLSLEAGRAQLGQAEGAEAALDEYIQGAGLEAWTFLVTWALNFVYSGRHNERGERPETSWNSTNDMNAAQTQALAQPRKYIRGFLSGPTVPQLDWAGELPSTRVDYNGEEVKTAQLVKWRQLEPGCVRAADLLEGWARACMEDPTKTLLPEDKWPDELPQPQVWVESQKDWHEICAGAAERGIFTFLKEQDVFHFQGKPLLSGLFVVEKKNKSLDSGEPVLRMIINAIPANALQQTIEADIRSLPYFGQWSAISVDEEDTVVVWNELDMTSAFYAFRLEPAWYKFQALAKPVSGQFASRWAEESVYPAVAVMAMVWKSSCGLLQQIHRKLCFPPKPMGAGLDPSREVRRDVPVPRSGRPHDTSFYSVYLDGFSHAELQHWNQLSHPEKWSWEAEAVQEAWDRWRVPSQTEKAIVNELELETLGCRIDGNAPRSVVSRLMVRPEPDPATPHSGNFWRLLGPLFPIQKGGQQACLSTIGIGSMHGERLTRKDYQSPERSARRSPFSFVPSAADAF